MKAIIDFCKTTLTGGALVVLPTTAIVMLLASVVRAARDALEPLTSRLSENIMFPVLSAAAVVILGCFLVGLFVRTPPGRWLGGLLERHVLERLPPYRLLKAVTGTMPSGQSGRGVTPALVEIEGGLVPALIMENHEDGYVTVFVPTPPIPTVGSIYVFDSSKVHPVDVPLRRFITCITAWGLGTKELRKAMRHN